MRSSRRFSARPGSGVLAASALRATEVVGCGTFRSRILHVAATIMHHAGWIDSFTAMELNDPKLCGAFKLAEYDGLGRKSGQPGPSSAIEL